MPTTIYEGGSGPVVDATVVKRKDGSNVVGEVPVVMLADSTGALVDPTSGAQLGAVTETAPATDTASSGLNGRLQRIAQRITAMFGTAGSAAANVLSVQGIASMTPLKVDVSAQSVSPFVMAPSSSAAGANPNGVVRVNAAGSTNATSVKGSSGRLFSGKLCNCAAYDVFFKLYNKASAPTVGTDAPLATILVKAGTCQDLVNAWGIPFSTGIAYAITKLQTDTDTTAVVAGDLTGLLVYA